MSNNVLALSMPNFIDIELMVTEKSGIKQVKQ